MARRGTSASRVSREFSFAERIDAFRAAASGRHNGARGWRLRETLVSQRQGSRRRSTAANASAVNEKRPAAVRAAGRFLGLNRALLIAAPKSDEETAVASANQQRSHRSEAEQAFAHVRSGGGDQSLTEISYSVERVLTVHAGDHAPDAVVRIRRGVGDIGKIAGSVPPLTVRALPYSICQMALCNAV